MNKSGPKITMRVEQGRFVPVSVFDREMMDGYRDGAVVEIEPVPPQTRTLERRYWAMLSALLATVDTPWEDVLDAHEKIKKQLGFVTPLRMQSGEWSTRKRHISTFSDAELSEFFAHFCEIIRKRFGLDPETLQTPSIEPESSGTPSNGRADDGPGADPIPASVGVPNNRSPSTLDDEPEAGGASDFIPRGTPSARGPHLRQEEWDWLKTVARMLVSATEFGGEVGIVDRQVIAIKEHLTPDYITSEAKEVAQLIYRHCRAVTKGDRPLDAKWVAYTAHCNPSDLRPEAR